MPSSDTWSMADLRRAEDHYRKEMGIAVESQEPTRPTAPVGVYTLTLQSPVPNLKNEREIKGKANRRTPRCVAEMQALTWLAKEQWPYAPLDRYRIRMHFQITKDLVDGDGRFAAVADALKVAGVIVDDACRYMIECGGWTWELAEQEGVVVTLTALEADSGSGKEEQVVVTLVSKTER